MGTELSYEKESDIYLDRSLCAGGRRRLQTATASEVSWAPWQLFQLPSQLLSVYSSLWPGLLGVESDLSLHSPSNCGRQWRPIKCTAQNRSPTRRALFLHGFWHCIDKYLK
jgi:hypothetical protein